MGKMYARIGSCKALFLAILLNSSLAHGAELSAISVPVLTDWLGDDGNWSPVQIRVGSPPQWLNVLPNTASQETWVVGAQGCGASVTSTCVASRGGLFSANISSSWQSVGYYDLGMDPQLYGLGSGYYGYDKIALSETLSMQSQIISVVNDTQYWLGFLGLGVKASSFTSDNKPTFLSTLANRTIPSRSYSYTAGAYYQLKQVPASLVLGGFDANRYHPHNVSFALDPNQRPVVSVNQIAASATSVISANTSSGWASNIPQVLLQPIDAALYTIDSSTPYLWLPEAACLRFEEAFGLVYNDALQLYLLNNTQKQMLESANITFTFELADLPGSSNSVSITLSYKALDLSLSYGYPGLSTAFPQMNSTSPRVPYFPLRKAANSTQYTIGRVFLQESYLIVDYERNNFSVSQAKFRADAIDNQAIINIYRLDANSTNSTKSTSIGSNTIALNTGAWIGIAVGTVLGLLAVTALLSYCVLKQRQKLQGNTSAPLKNKYLRWFQKWVMHEEPEPSCLEIGSSDFQKPVEVNGQDYCKEMATEFHKAIELPSATRSSVPLGHDPAYPVELPSQSVSNSKSDLDLPQISPTSPDLPAYFQQEMHLHGSDARHPSTMSVPVISPLSSIFPAQSDDTAHGDLCITPEGQYRGNEEPAGMVQADYRLQSVDAGPLQASREYPSRAMPKKRPFSWEE